MATDNQHLRYIDGLRGAAVVMVMCRHFYLAAFAAGLPRWADVLGLGYLGVHFFLLLSGFCIAWAYVGPHARSFTSAEFAYRRATRILPPYYVALGISLALWLLVERRAPGTVFGQVLTHVTMTHNFFRSTVLELNGPFWSLALESQLYVAFPFLLLGFRRFGVARVLALVLVVQSAFRIFVMRYGTGYTDMTFVIPWSVAGRLFEFALGMWAAELVSHGVGARLRSAARFGLGAVAALLAGLAWLAKGRLGVSHPLTDLLWTAAFFCVLIGASSPRGLLYRALSFGPVTGLGVMCFSTYLIHALVLEPVTNLLLARFGGLSPLFLLPAVFAATLVPCYAFYRLVERPFIQLFRARRRSPIPAAIAP